MASLKDLEDALLNADAAGDAESARILADEIVKMRAALKSAFSSNIPGKTRLSTDGEIWAENHPWAAGAATFLQGVPFVGEYFDEVAGAAAPYISNNSAETATRTLRGAQSAFAEQNPKTALGLKIGGGITGSAVGIAAAPAAITGYAPATMGGRVLYGGGVGGALGGAEGAVSGYGAGEDPQSRQDSAVTRGLLGVGLGSTIGAAMPFAQEGIMRGANRVLDWWNISNQARQAGLSKPSYEILTRAMDADGSLQGPGAARINAAGPDAMLADAGPSSRALLDTTIQKSGRAGLLAGQAVEQRAGQANQVATNALDRTLGRPVGIKSTETAIRQGTARARSTAYDAAYAAPINYAAPEGQSLEQLLRRVPMAAIRKSRELMRVEGESSRQVMASIDSAGNVTYREMPDVMQIDYITRALNEVAEQADASGKLGGTTATGRAYGNLARDIRTTLAGDPARNIRGLVPEYRVALDTAAEPIAARNALQFGSKMFSPSVTRDDVMIGLRGMSQAERSNAAAGLRSAIDEKFAQVKQAVSDGNMDAREAIAAVKEMSSRANHQKVEALVGRQAADQMFESIDRAAMALDLRAGVTQNSKTFARTEMDRTVREQSDSGVWNAVKAGQPINAGRRVVQMLLGGTPEAKQAAEDTIYEEIARALTGPRGANARGLLQVLQNIGRQSPQNAVNAKALSGLLGSPVAPYQIGTQLLREQETRRGPR